MDQQSPLQEAMELHGADAMGIATNMMIRYLCNAMPNPPVSPAMPLASAVAARASADSVDQISGLPDEILKYVFSRLPASPSCARACLPHAGAASGVPCPSSSSTPASSRIPPTRCASG
ncbi:hypothetical protein EJB05_51637, partial [Eragrostis curvula]